MAKYSDTGGMGSGAGGGAAGAGAGAGGDKPGGKGKGGGNGGQAGGIDPNSIDKYSFGAGMSTGETGTLDRNTGKTDPSKPGRTRDPFGGDRSSNDGGSNIGPKPANAVPSYGLADAMYGPLNAFSSIVPGGALINGLSKIATGDISSTPADAFGLQRGPQTGWDRASTDADINGNAVGGNRGGGMMDGEDGQVLISSDRNALQSPMAEAMETLLEYSSKGGDPTKKQVPIQRQTAIPSPFTGQSAGVVA